MFKKSPALFFLLFVVAGVLVADSFRFNSSVFFFSLIISSLIALYFHKAQNKTTFVIAIAIGIMSFVGLRFSILYYEKGVGDITNFADSKTSYVIYGEVVDWPDLKLEQTELVVDVDSLEGQKVVDVNGRILLKINSITTKFQRGDKLVFSGKIYKVSGARFSKEFNYNRFLRYKGLSGVVYLATPLHVLHDKAHSFSVIPLVDKLRDFIKNSFQTNLSPVSSALASGFLIGETRDISKDLYKRFKDSGTLHLLAVSGSNVILVLTFFAYMMNPFMITRKKRSIILMAVVLLFSLLSYGEPSVVRASIMAGLVLMAGLVERKYDLKNIIAVAAFLILLYEPSQLFDLGFQLSFVIAWGLILVVPKLNLLFEKQHQKKWYRFLLFPLLVSMTAQLFSVGLIGLYFKQIPLLSPIANLFIVPLVSIAVIGVLVLLVADFIMPILGLFVGSLLNSLLEFTVAVVNFFGADSMPLLFVYEWSIVGVVCLYFLLFMLPFAFFSKANRRLLLFILLVFLNIFVGQKSVAAFSDSNSIDIRYINIPGGVLTSIVSKPFEADIVITGIKGKKYELDEKIVIPFLQKNKITKINKLIILKSDFSAIDDLLRLSKKYAIQKIYLPQSLKNSFDDQIQNLSFATLKQSLVVMYRTQKMPEEEGYNFDSLGFSFVFSGNKILFVDKIFPVHLKKLSSNYKHLLVLGSNWNVSFNDYLLMQELGYEKIICSKIAQPLNGFNEALFVKSTEFIVDLQKQSEYLQQISY